MKVESRADDSILKAVADLDPLTGEVRARMVLTDTILDERR